MYVKDLKKKFLVIKNGGISRWTLMMVNDSQYISDCVMVMMLTLW